MVSDKPSGMLSLWSPKIDAFLSIIAHDDTRARSHNVAMAVTRATTPKQTKEKTDLPEDRTWNFKEQKVSNQTSQMCTHKLIETRILQDSVIGSYRRFGRESCFNRWLDVVVLNWAITLCRRNTCWWNQLRTDYSVGTWLVLELGDYTVPAEHLLMKPVEDWPFGRIVKDTFHAFEYICWMCVRRMA